MKSLSLLLLSSCLLFSSTVFALRCGHVLVDLGDSKQDVLDKCGDPESVDSHIESRGVVSSTNASQYAGISQNNPNGLRSYTGGALSYGQQQYGEITVIVDEWIYDFGRRRLQQYLRFENGRLKEVKTLGRGG